MEHVIEYYLDDDGTMDTVVNCECSCGRTWTERIDGEIAADYRGPDGILLPDDLCRLADELDIECPSED